ncbi:MAG: HAD-IA family hydrolase [Paracoccaceae bacterium]|nr:HAD-IA family hydrolase [Paracoccaceae bacterium]
MTDLSLVLFDVDGTLVDSQAHIAAAFGAMYAASGRTPPERSALLSVVGLSLPVAIARLEPDLGPAECDQWAETYRAAFATLDGYHSPSPLYPGAIEALERLHGLEDVLLGVATGKSRRGLRHVFAAHDLAGLFATCQTADEHPSKPHPSMVDTACRETGVAPARTVLVGDTAYDIEMGRAAGVATIGVTWGYHPEHMLRAAGADAIIADFAALPAALRAVSAVPA